MQRGAQRLSHPGRSALERSMGTTAQRESVPHYPPRLPTDPGSVTTRGTAPARSHPLSRTTSAQLHQPAQQGTPGSGLASRSGGNGRGKTNCSLHQQAEEASRESREQGWLLQVQRAGRQMQNSGEVFSLIVGEMDAWTDGHEEAGERNRPMCIQNICTRYNQTEHLS